MRVTASAPGKLVLFGDHAAVYGKPCLVTAVDLRFSVTAWLTAQDAIQIETPELRARGEIYQIAASQVSASNRPETAFVEAALVQLFKRKPLKNGLKITTAGPPQSYGLGSSSAITAATIVAVAHLLELEFSLRDIFDLSYAAVLDVQGTGSGIDLAAAVYGGTLYYVKGGEIIEPLNLNDLPVAIGYSGDKVSTTNLIKHVAGLRARQPHLIDPIINLMGEISNNARDTMLRGDWQATGELMNINQGLLDSLGVNVPQLANLIFAARTAGAWGAKLSGAGGGDCMFSLVDPGKRPEVDDAVNAAGGTAINIVTNVAGVRLEPGA